MDKRKQQLIAGRAGKLAHKMGKAHTYTSEEARSAGGISRRRARAKLTGKH